MKLAKEVSYMVCKKRNRKTWLLMFTLFLSLAWGCTGDSGGGSGSSQGTDTGLSLIVPPPDPGGSGGGTDGGSGSIGSLATVNLTVNVVDETGAPIVGGFRWLVEEDTTYEVIPGSTASETLGTGIHRSHSPVLSAGIEPTSSASIPVPDNLRLFVSVLPSTLGWQMGGAEVEIGQPSVTITVNSPPIPTARISVFVFEDNQPLNNAPDLPAEKGLEGFGIVIHDIGGHQMMDVFGNMLGTTYMMNPDGTYMLDVEGNPIVDMMGSGQVVTDANGEALIENIAPNKYGVLTIPPSGTDWVQTTTIEGTPVVDAWVRAGEPRYLSEFGLYTWHIFHGYAHPMEFPDPGAGTVGNITGQVLYLHQAKPPKPRGTEGGWPPPYAWVALNDLNAADNQIYAGPCDENGNFDIQNVPPGTYQLVVWDWALDVIIDFRTVIMPAGGGTVALGEVPVFGWFGNYEGSVFYDSDEDGFRDPGEVGIPDQALNLRYTDGSVYKATATNMDGDFCMTEVFPFFYNLIAEVDFARFKATGATFVVDDGGTVDPGQKLNPQIQPGTGLPYRTEVGEVLTQSMLLYAGQSALVDWGKKVYAPGENGGISGVAVYATTRAEDDPSLAGPEPWEPGIPRVQVNLYLDSDFDFQIDDLADPDSVPTLADVDNYPLGWGEGGLKGPEDLDRNNDGVFDTGDAVAITWTDSWDDSNPTGCVETPVVVHGRTVRECAEIYRNWNQMRPAVFDGGYAFASYVPNGIVSGGTEIDGLPSGYYIVEATTPPGYEHQKEEDKNVDFGDSFVAVAAVPTLGPPACVGDPHVVPAELSLFPGVEAAFAGESRPLCDRKQVLVRDQQNTAADFHLFTVVPKAGRIWGWAADDFKYEYDPNSANIGTNYAPPFLPIAIRDFRYHEIVRTYTDEFGKYNALVPSNYNNMMPAPSGMSASMLLACINDPGPIPDGMGGTMEDPFYNATYSTNCYTLDFYPGKTTRLDTPIVPIGAMSAAREQRLDCEPPDGTPVIAQVDGPGGGPYTAPANNITLTSQGNMEVPNPDYDPNNPLSPLTVTRDYGFGAIQGTVRLDGIALPVVSWGNTGIQVTVPGGSVSGQLMVRRGDNFRTSIMGITLHVDNGQIPAVHWVTPVDDVQAVIDAALPNSLILLGPGVYEQNLIMWKPLKLQGAGALSTTLKAGPRNPTETNLWADSLNGLVAGGNLEFLPGQLDVILNQGGVFQPPGVLVSFANGTSVDSADPPLIDGLLITGSIANGAVFINTHAPYTKVSNNRIKSNSGQYGGGVRVGTPSVPDGAGGFLGSDNAGVMVEYNQIMINGAFLGGGGISLFNGSDGYKVFNNYICGNFTVAYGGGIAHFGLSDGCSISDNNIMFNEAFDEGGGVIIAGELVPAEAPLGTLSPGSGSVTLNGNLIQGNLSNDDGGGLRTLTVSGQDVSDNPGDSTMWWEINLFNNMIVNNVASDAGGGISMDDTAMINIINNTIAHNDSTSTAIDAFGTCNPAIPADQFCPSSASTTSVPMVGGVHSRGHSAGLILALAAAGSSQLFSDPVLEDNIIFQNRTFYWEYGYNGTWGGLRPDVMAGATPIYWDLAVTGTAAPEMMSPSYCVLTDATGYDVSNSSGDPLFLTPYFNEFYGTGAGADALGPLITIAFKPIVPTGNYHISAGSSAENLGGGAYYFLFSELQWDYDGQDRPDPINLVIDAGADER